MGLSRTSTSILGETNERPSRPEKVSGGTEIVGLEGPVVPSKKVRLDPYKWNSGIRRFVHFRHRRCRTGRVRS